ncbi:GNAT family N-acetyltransferase [Alkalicoccobacillus porphyridii]|nr:GNAT family N-acetyltransferase [Alkalicoccobacillus porphyridii]
MNIRKFKEADRHQVLDLAKRFNHVEYMEFRDNRIMSEKQMDLAYQAVTNNTDNIYVADDSGHILGYIELTIQKDYFTERKQAYISAIAVSVQGEGKGIGKALMKQAELWASNLGLSELILDVFVANERAVKMYEHLGYHKEIVKMVKQNP